MSNFYVCRAENNSFHDVQKIIFLISLSDENAMLHVSNCTDIRDARKKFEENFHREDVYFGYKNVLVIKEKEKIVGCIVFFSGEEEDGFKNIVEESEVIEKEAENDELYIDSLAVDEDYRGLGLAKKLVNAVFKEAKVKGINKVSLIVDEKKEYLLGVYKKMGFHVANKVTLITGSFYKMEYGLK